MTPEIIAKLLFAVVFGVIYLAILALLIVSMWKIYVKMGEPGWKCIVPIYNSYVLIERLRKPRSWFWILMLCSLIFIVLYTMLLVQVVGTEAHTLSGGSILLMLANFAVIVVMLVYEIKIMHALSKAFGQGAGFTVGMILLPVIFFPVLAFGSYRFLPNDEPAEAETE